MPLFHICKNYTTGISLVVQWLRLRLPKQGMCIGSLVRELRFHVPHDQKNRTQQQKQYWNKFSKDFLKIKNIYYKSNSYTTIWSQIWLVFYSVPVLLENSLLAYPLVILNNFWTSVKHPTPCLQTSHQLLFVHIFNLMMKTMMWNFHSKTLYPALLWDSL